MEQICLVHIDIDHIVAPQRFLGDIILNRADLTIHKQLFSVHIPREPTHPVVHRDDVRIKRTDQVIECRKRRDLPAGRHVDIHPEGSNAGLRMVFRIGMYRHMTFIQMGQLCLASRQHGILRDQKRNRSPLRLIILAGNIQNRCSDHIRQGRKNPCKTFRIILFVYIINIVFLLSCRLGITDIINVKAQGFGQVIKPV